MKCYTGKIQSQKERNTDYDINDTGISDKTSCIHFVIQNICSPKSFAQYDGFQPPSSKKDANIYIK